MTAELAATRIVTGYGKQQIVNEVSLRARAGEITCVFGPNGSGKSTLIKAVAGAIPVWSGDVRLDGTDITNLPAHKVVRHGVVMMPQGGGVFPKLSVRDNLRIGGYSVPDEGTVKTRIAQLLEEFPALKNRLNVNAGNLSGGEQMMVAVARVLVSQPRFILFDEPSAGLAPAMVHDALERIQQLRDRGVGVVVVEQNIRESLPLANSLYILAGGKEQFHGTSADIQDDDQLMDLYMRA
jgi:branched-chain amino acid transport system ATP-binding protein